MRYNQLGRTGVRVSAIALGTATFGVAPDPKEADRIVGRALDLGVNFFDTANSYGNQSRFDRPGAPPAMERASAEKILGDALLGKRDRVILCSKVMEPVGEQPNDRGLSRVHIFNQIDATLRRLGTDHIDVYYAHHPDASTPLDQTLRAFDDLIRQGKVRYCALSTYPAWQLVEALWLSEKFGLNSPVCVQIPYNLALRSAEADVLPACVRHGLSATIFSPLAGGVFASEEVSQREFAGHRRWGGPGFSERQLDLARKLREIANRGGYAAATLAVAWLLSRPAVCSAIIGPESVAELEGNMAAADIALPDEVMKEVNAVGEQTLSPWSFF